MPDAFKRKAQRLLWSAVGGHLPLHAKRNLLPNDDYRGACGSQMLAEACPQGPTGCEMEVRRGLGVVHNGALVNLGRTIV